MSYSSFKFQEKPDAFTDTEELPPGQDRVKVPHRVVERRTGEEAKNLLGILKIQVS